MENTNNTLFDIEDFKNDCEKHSQFCLSIQTLLENGCDPKHLLDVIDEMREQAESIESLSKHLNVKPIPHLKSA